MTFRGESAPSRFSGHSPQLPSAMRCSNAMMISCAVEAPVPQKHFTSSRSSAGEIGMLRDYQGFKDQAQKENLHCLLFITADIALVTLYQFANLRNRWRRIQGAAVHGKIDRHSRHERIKHLATDTPA